MERAGAAGAIAPSFGSAQPQSVLTRPIPSTGKTLPLIGLQRRSHRGTTVPNGRPHSPLAASVARRLGKGATAVRRGSTSPFS